MAIFGFCCVYFLSEGPLTSGHHFNVYSFALPCNHEVHRSSESNEGETECRWEIMKSENGPTSEYRPLKCVPHK